MNTEKFTGKAQAYANARPGYPDEAVEYIFDNDSFSGISLTKRGKNSPGSTSGGMNCRLKTESEKKS